MTIETSIQIRDAQPDEMGTILNLTQAAYAEFANSMSIINWRGLSATLVKTLTDPGEADVIIALQGDEIVGSVLLFPAESNAYGELAGPASLPQLRLLAVKQSVRGQGIGTMLMEECISRARQSGATALGLHTGDSMIVAQPMYERRGFVRNPVLDFDVEGGELVKAYRLDLKSG